MKISGPPWAGVLTVGLALTLGPGMDAGPATAASDGAVRSACGPADGASDALLDEEARTLGRDHACDHLSARRQHPSGLSHPAPSGDLAAAAPVGAAAVVDPAVVGSWSTAVNPGTKTIGVTSVLLHTGKVLLIGGKYATNQKNDAAYLYDPVTRTGREVPAPGPVFCSGITVLADGRVLSVGGADPVPRGVVDVHLFDPVSERWIRQPDTPLGRFYPTLTKLPDGRVVVVAGNKRDGTQNPNVEVYTPPPTGSVLGSLKVVGPPHLSSSYPRQWVLPDGSVLKVANRQVHSLDPSTWTWTLRKPLTVTRAGGPSGLLLAGDAAGSSQVLMAGGSLNKVARNTTETLNFREPNASWKAGPVMPNARAHMSLVQVPDGSAIGVGGNSYDLYQQEQRQTLHFKPTSSSNPTGPTWTTLATQNVRRAYHSTAVLLPDGSIMSAGDNGAGGGGQAIDVFSPPYLFRSERPAITVAPTTLSYGTTGTLTTSGPAVTRAVLMAPGATTHANDMHARHVELTLAPAHGGGLTVAAPTAAVAPPGWYMLFALDAAGTPSVAKWIQIGP